MMIPFNVPYLSGKETDYIVDAVTRKKLSGNGYYTQKCQAYLKEHYHFGKVLLTNSCTDALEMAALLARLAPGDEVIVPSFTFVSTANAFLLHGGKVIFADSCSNEPNLDVQSLEALITPRTRAIAPVHYAGVAVDMGPLMELAKKYNLLVMEDAAQAIDSYYRGQALGSIGHTAAFSFHETKNIISGEGGALTINSPELEERAEIIWEKGTNRAAFFRGEVAKYNWVDLGASYLPSEVTAAFLFAQLEQLTNIQQQRKTIWQRYHDGLAQLEQAGHLHRPFIPDYATNNAHMYYILCNNLDERTGLLAHLKENGIYATFHYLALHESPYYAGQHDGRELPNARRYADTLLRLPMYYELAADDQQRVIDMIHAYYKA